MKNPFAFEAPTGDALRADCKRMGVTRAGSEGPDWERVMQERWFTAKNAERQRLWLLAVLASAIASVISAAAAWTAVLLRP
jgi:hypothetical protein